MEGQSCLLFWKEKILHKNLWKDNAVLNLIANNIIKPEMLTQNKAKFLKLISDCDNSDLSIGKGSYKRIMRIKLHWEHLILSKSIYERGKIQRVWSWWLWFLEI